MLHIYFDRSDVMATFQINLDLCNLPRYIREQATSIFETDSSVWAGLVVHKDRHGLFSRNVEPCHLDDIKDWLAARGTFDPSTTMQQRLQALTRISEKTGQFVKIPADVMAWVHNQVEGDA